MCVSHPGSIQMVRSSLWEKATRWFDSTLPEIFIGSLPWCARESHGTDVLEIAFICTVASLVVVAQR